MTQRRTSTRCANCAQKTRDAKRAVDPNWSATAILSPLKANNYNMWYPDTTAGAVKPTDADCADVQPAAYEVHPDPKRPGDEQEEVNYLSLVQLMQSGSAQQCLRIPVNAGSKEKVLQCPFVGCRSVSKSDAMRAKHILFHHHKQPKPMGIPLHPEPAPPAPETADIEFDVEGCEPIQRPG